MNAQILLTETDSGDMLGAAISKLAEAIVNAGGVQPTVWDRIWDLAPALVSLLAVLVSVGALILNYRSVGRTIRLAAARDVGKLYLERCISQLNEFYGPIRVLNLKSKALYQKLVEEKPPDWHFLNNVDAVLANDNDKQTMAQIISTNKEIADILRQKGGLIVDLVKPPESFERFLKHYELVAAAFSKKPRPSYELSDTFPRSFDQDILNGCEELHTEIEWITSQARNQLEEAFSQK